MRSRARGRPRHPDLLTPAEQRVLPYVRQGLTNAEIADRFGLSPETVKYHVGNMLSKLGLADRLELAAWTPEGERPTRRTWLTAFAWRLGGLVRSLARTMRPEIAFTTAVFVLAAGIVLLLVRTRGGDDPAVQPPGPEAATLTAVAVPSSSTPPASTTSPSRSPASTAPPTPTASPSETPTPTATPAPLTSTPGPADAAQAVTFTDVRRDPVAVDPNPHGQPLIYDTHTGEVKAAGMEDWIISWRPGTSEALVAVDGKLALYNAETGQWRDSNVPSLSPAYYSAWSPDGRVLLLQDNGGESHFVLLDLDSLLLTRMEEHTGVSPSHEWSPGGRWVALDAWGTDDVSVHVYDLQAGLRRVGSYGRVAKRWLDDQTLLVSDGNPERFTLLHVDVSGVTAGGSIAAASFFSSVSPSGQRIADVRDPYLVLYDVRSQSAHELDSGYYAQGEALKAPHSYEWSGRALPCCVRR